MNRLTAPLRLAAFAALTLPLAASSIHAQETRDQAVAAMRKVEAKEMDPHVTKAAPFAQKLVDEALAKHPEVLLLAIHGGAPRYDIIASNFGRIGKLGDEDDLRCIHTGKDNLEISKDGKHFEDETPLRDKAGKIIGALGVVFRYKAGDDKAAMQKIADQIREEMKAQLTTPAKLMGPA